MKYCGEETKRAEENFPLEYKKTNKKWIYAVAEVKKAAALTYKDMGIKPEMYQCIADICDEITDGKFDDSFCIDALQGGAGTSTNMNVNEVLALVASKRLGYFVHSIDDCNKGQSTNDVCPTALRIAAIRDIRLLSGECAKLQESLQKRENEFEDIKKCGRTELMNAVAISLGDEFGCYAQAIARDRWRIYKAEERLRQVNIGGTAVGKCDNADRKYRFGVIEKLRDITGIGLAAAEYPMDLTQNNDVFCEMSGLIKALSVNLLKICGDLRLMNSEPYGEIHLAAMQKGSSIMPAKVNPVIPECVIQCAIKVQADDYAVTMAASHGEFELNAFEPLIAECVLEELELMTAAVKILREKCVDLLTADEKRCKELLDNSYCKATAYSNALGYDIVAEVVKGSKNPKECYAKLDEMINLSK